MYVTASQFVPFTDLDADNIEKDAANMFTPTVSAPVKKKIGSINNYAIWEILDRGERVTYVI